MLPGVDAPPGNGSSSLSKLARGPRSRDEGWVGPALLFWGPPDPSLLPHVVWASCGLLGGFKPFTTLGVQMGATELYKN